MKKILLCLIISSLLISNVFASETFEINYVIEGDTKIIKSSELYNINPYNPAKILGVGENKSTVVLTDSSKIIIPLETPLYKISDIYRDRIICKKGIWGVERNITKKVFDGSENWNINDNYKFKNDKTTLFYYDIGEKLNIKEVLSTHFDNKAISNNIDITHKSNIYDGITINKNRSQCDIRIMNVRNVTTLDDWKQYLELQKNNGNPVSLLYVSPNPKFEPFEQDIQKQLNSADMGRLGFTDNITPVIKDLSKREIVKYPFNDDNTWESNGKYIGYIGEAFEDIKIYNANSNDKFFIDSVYSQQYENRCIINIKKQSNGENDDIFFTSEINYFDFDFLKDKKTEIIMTSKNDTNIKITVMINFSKFKIPTENITGLSYSETGIKSECIIENELVLPEKFPVVEGHFSNVFYNNVYIGADINNNEYTVDISDRLVDVPAEIGSGVTKTVLFLGDSIIDQNYYTKAVKELFDNDVMKIKLIGKRGEEGNPHEGRGGWSAYDYCKEAVKYGINNPFLNNGNFDFKYYMENNKFDDLDYVFINLGINDLNQRGHNTHYEILSNYDKIVKSIKSFNPNVKIFIGLPTMLFGTENTIEAKNTRLNFIKDLKLKYDNNEYNNIFTVPLYTTVDAYNDFKFQEVIQSYDNPSTQMVVNDTTHMGVSGYNKIADTTFNSFKYAQYLEEKNK